MTDFNNHPITTEAGVYRADDIVLLTTPFRPESDIVVLAEDLPSDDYHADPNNSQVSQWYVRAAMNAAPTHLLINMEVA